VFITVQRTVLFIILSLFLVACSGTWFARIGACSLSQRPFFAWVCLLDLFSEEVWLTGTVSVKSSKENNGVMEL